MIIFRWKIVIFFLFFSQTIIVDTVLTSTDDLDKYKYKSYVAPRKDIQEQQVLRPISGHKYSEPL